MFVLGFIAGLFLGMILYAALAIENINEKDSLIRASRKSLRKAENTIVSQSNTIKNLENNLEFVTNNLSAQKKKLVGLSDQD